MNKYLNYDFVVNKDNNNIKISREFAANISLVWDAYTNQFVFNFFRPLVNPCKTSIVHKKNPIKG